MRIFGILGSVGLFLGVALGAFGAHFLRARLDVQMQTVFETGVRYQMYHSLALLAVAFLVVRAPIFSYAGIFYTVGIILFSFSLYAMAFTGSRNLGMITPLGGLCFLAGHLVLILGFVRLSV